MHACMHTYIQGHLLQQADHYTMMGSYKTYIHACIHTFKGTCSNKLITILTSPFTSASGLLRYMIGMFLLSRRTSNACMYTCLFVCMHVCIILYYTSLHKQTYTFLPGHTRTRTHTQQKQQQQQHTHTSPSPDCAGSGTETCIHTHTYTHKHITLATLCRR